MIFDQFVVMILPAFEGLDTPGLYSVRPPIAQTSLIVVAFCHRGFAFFLKKKASAEAIKTRSWRGDGSGISVEAESPQAV